MALRNIVVQGEPCLEKVCRTINDFNPRLHQMLDDMLETVEDANGAGLAAPQVGVMRRACLVIDEETGEFIELLNPEFVHQKGEQTDIEGCLSVPGKYGLVTRPMDVRVRAQDRFGGWFELEAQGLTARAICHEMEHLEGHLFVEHVDHFMSEEEIQAYMDAKEEYDD
ncbi:peptide deformylase [Bengtsoniella intestinalis]|uniref:peptide deformylase n=1 Tax=Bengtsoniella intestinalis TaxID=3073143 RepID=UPI00391FC7E3